MARGAHSRSSLNMSSGRTPGSSSRASLLFSLEDGLEKLGATSAVETEYDPVLEVQQLKQACGHTDAETKLFAALQEAKASSILAVGAVDLWHVGSYLRSKHGYLVLLRQANIAKRPKAYLRMLRHSYLVCRGLEGADGADVLIDVAFKDHFVLPHSTGWYSKLVAALPQDWVGTASALAPLVGLMSAGMRLCFKQAGIPLPPWREGRAVLSKWVPEVYEEEALPLVPLPDPALRRMLAPYHTPFRSAVRAAAAMQPAPFVLADAQQRQRQQQQQHQVEGAAGARSQLPPLPRPSSGAVLAAAAAVKAAAAVGGVCGAAVAASGHGQGCGGHADVPRRIIVGFPEQRTLAPPPCAAPAHGQAAAPAAAQQPRQASGGSSTAAALTAGCGSAMTAILAQQQKTTTTETTVHGSKHTGGLQVLPHVAAAAAAAAPAAAPAAATVGEDVSLLRPVARSPAGALVSPTGGPLFAAAATAAASNSSRGAAAAGPAVTAAALSGCSALVELVAGAAPGCGKVLAAQQRRPPQQEQQQPLLQQQHSERPAASRPAFTSTQGVVMATAGASSPGVVINREWLRQQLGQQVAAEPGDCGGSNEHPAAAAADDGDQGGGKDGAAAEVATEAAAAAKGVSGQGLRQFKSLDQLLPRMRTVRLGAA